MVENVERLETTAESEPLLTGLRYLVDTNVWSMIINYSYNGTHFSVLASARDGDTPQAYELDQSIEGKFLIEISKLSWGEFTQEKDMQTESLENELAKLAGDACLPPMRELAPLPVPEPRTLQEKLYPELYALQVLTEGKRVISRKLEGYDLPLKYVPLPEDRLREIGLDESIPVLKPPEVMLGDRLQSLVWKVNIDGQEMVCKISVDIFEEAICNELEAYLKIGKANVGASFKVPELKGIIRSHDGVIGILLNYIPHKHHSLRMLLADVENGIVPASEATQPMKRKWAVQIKESLAQLHQLDILWRDIKTDKVLIDEDGDAVLVDFGGGNTVGWVDADKYGTMEGEL